MGCTSLATRKVMSALRAVSRRDSCVGRSGTRRRKCGRRGLACALDVFSRNAVIGDEANPATAWRVNQHTGAAQLLDESRRPAEHCGNLEENHVGLDLGGIDG